jgi:hypothetical protein
VASRQVINDCWCINRLRSHRHLIQPPVPPPAHQRRRATSLHLRGQLPRSAATYGTQSQPHGHQSRRPPRRGRHTSSNHIASNPLQRLELPFRADGFGQTSRRRSVARSRFPIGCSDVILEGSHVRRWQSSEDGDSGPAWLRSALVLRRTCRGGSTSVLGKRLLDGSVVDIVGDSPRRSRCSDFKLDLCRRSNWSVSVGRKRSLPFTMSDGQNPDINYPRVGTWRDK